MNQNLSMTPTLPIPAAPPVAALRRGLLLATSATGGAAVIATAIPFISTLAPSERAKAAGGPVEVDVSDLQPGDTRIVEWRGKPVWIVRRTRAMIKALRGHDAQLVDPQSTRQQQPAYATNGTRSIDPEWFVAIGICTHLGCSPSAVPAGDANPAVPADWPGGFYCPCHASTFDGAGRVFKNKPAPTNLEIPPHRFEGSARLMIGADSPA